MLITALASKPTLSPAQYNLLAGKIFQDVQEPSIYKCYDEKSVFTFWTSKAGKKQVIVDVDTLYFGFYDSCVLPNLDNLKSSGSYYFEVNAGNFLEEVREVDIHNACAEFDLFIEGKDTLMNLFYNSRQQYVTYRKIDKFPANIQKYLKKRGIKLGSISNKW